MEKYCITKVTKKMRQHHPGRRLWPEEVLTASDPNVTKNEFFESLSESELLKLKAKGFDFLVGKFGQVPDDITEYLYSHVVDIVKDGKEFQWRGSGPDLNFKKETISEHYFLLPSSRN